MQIISKNTLKRLIESNKSAVIVISENKIGMIDTPPSGFGEQTICWQNNKPTHAKYNFSNKIL